jgi:fumarate reductase subunit D
MKRSNKPIFWALFGAGGMLSALTGPVLVWMTGIAIPLGIGLPSTALDYANVQALLHNVFAKLALLAVISLFLFHGFHRFYHTIHDFGVHVGSGIKATCHGLAFVGTLMAAWYLFRI